MITSPNAYALPPVVQVIEVILPLPSVITVNSAPVPLTGATLVWVTPVVVVSAVYVPFPAGWVILPIESIDP